MQHFASPEALQSIRQALLAHYQQHQRVLPWRQTRDPYAIWVSEIMLQQTQVETVVPRYHAFLERFPTIEALAQASTSDVCEAWAGLGYYRRARHLHQAAQYLQDKHCGKLPANLDALLAIPGVGTYTAGAIASIAFDMAAPLVDGNVARVLSRLFKMPDPPDTTSGRKKLWSWAGQLVVGKRPGDFNQSLMELGATLCKPRTPQCARCPVADFCQAHQHDMVDAFPAPKKRVVKQDLTIAFAWLAQPTGIWLVQRSPHSPLWSGLWELPSASGPDATAILAQQTGGKLGRALASVRHSLTHRNITATIYQGPNLKKQPELEAAKLWQAPLDAPLSTLARKAIVATQRAML